MNSVFLILAAVVSTMPVVIEKDASPSQRYAAEELARYVGKITGREMPVKVQGESEGQGEKCVRIVTTDEYGEDGFRLQMKEGDLVIGGSKIHGCLYGVYEILETYGGCGWFSSTCEVVPKAAKVEVPDDLDVVQKPAFDMREPYWFDLMNPDFASRLRANGGGMNLKEKHGGLRHRFAKDLWLCHTFQKLVPPEKYFDKHPEYFSEVRGKRVKETTQLCLTNPDVLEIVVSNVLARIALDPTVGYAGVSQNDWANYCTCEKCRAIDEEEGSPSGTVIRFVNAVAERVEKVYPKVKIETLAYQYSRRPPKKTRVRHNVVPCLCSIECRVSKPLAAKSCPENASFVEDLKGWAAQAEELFVWDYTTDFSCYVYPMANVKALAENIRLFRDNHVRSLFAQGDYQGAHGHFAELKAWIIAKLMWNPDQDLDKLVKRFMAGYFGAAAPFARQYYDRLHALPRADNRQLWIYENPLSDNVPDSFLEWSAGLWKKAANAVRNDPVRARNVRMAAMADDAVRFWRLNNELAPKKYLMVSDPAAYRAQYEKRCREAVPIARNLVACLDEEPRIVFTESYKGRKNFPEPEIRAAASGFKSVEPVATGDEIVFNGEALSLVLPGVYGEIVDDPLATDGKAFKLFTNHRNWAVMLQLDQIAFDDAEYVLSVRVRTEQDAGVTNKAFWCGIEGGEAHEDTHTRKVMATEIEPGYTWYDIVTWKPSNSQYVWLGPGVSPVEGLKVRATYLDVLRLRKVKGKGEKGKSEACAFARKELRKYAHGRAADFTPLTLDELKAKRNGEATSPSLRKYDRIIAKLETSKSRESYVLASVKEPGEKTRVLIVGKTAEATLYGAYALLEDYLGFRFFHAGKGGTVAPARLDAPIPADLFDFREPRVNFRRISHWYGSVRPSCEPDAYDEWLIRRGYQNDRKKDGLTALVKGVPPELFETHPEYFPMAGGKRSLDVAKRYERRCCANPEVQRLTAAKAVEFCRDGGSLLLNVRNVTGFWCECDACRKMGMGTNGLFSVTDYVHRFHAAVAALILKDLPDVDISVHAYRDFRFPPQQQGLVYDPRVRLIYSPIPRCYAHPITAPCNGRYRREMEEWHRRAAKTGIFGWSSSSRQRYTPIASTFAEEIRWLVDNGFDGWLDNNTAAGDKLSHSVGDWRLFYLASKMFWNPDLDAKALLADADRRYYGVAYGPMAKYRALYLQRWAEAPGHAAAGAFARHTQALKPGDAEKMLGWLAEAEKLAAGDEDLLARIGYDRIGLERYWIGEGEKVARQLAAQPVMPALRTTTAATLRTTASATLRTNGEATSSSLQQSGNDKSSNFPSDAEWARATAKNLMCGTNPPAEKVTVKLLYDDANWYVRFEQEFSGEAIATITARDGDLWTEDAVEIFVTPPGEGWRQVIVSPKDVIYDADGPCDVDWSYDGAARNVRTGDRLVTDVRLPVAKLRGNGLGVKGTWRFRFSCDNRRKGCCSNLPWHRVDVVR